MNKISTPHLSPAGAADQPGPRAMARVSRFSRILTSGLFILGGSDAMAQSGDVVALDPAVEAIVSLDARVETLYEGRGFLEGPSWLNDGKGGYLIFTDIAENTIRKWERNGKVSVLHAAFKSPDESSVTTFDIGLRKTRMAGPDGTVVDPEGRIIFAGYGTRSIVRIEQNGQPVVLADRYESNQFNTPNDLVLRSDGALYFTDSASDADLPKGHSLRGVPHSGLYLLKDGKVTALVKDAVAPNGLAFSPDEKYLYLNETYPMTIKRYVVNRDGSISSPTLFIDMKGSDAKGRPDGMKVDRNGFVFCTGPGGLWIISPQGKHIGTIKTGEVLTNMAFGGEDGSTLFMTSWSYLYRIRLKPSAR